MIDGGSTDGSKDVIEQYKSAFSYWCSEPDNGVYHAQNKGIAKATGEYVNCMNSGDVYVEKDTLAHVIREGLVGDVVYGDWIRDESVGMIYKSAPSVMSPIFIFTDNVCHQSMFVKTQLLQEKGFDENMKIFADWQRWREMVWEGKHFQYLSFPICLYEPGGLSDTSSPQNTLERKMMYERIPIEIKASVDEHTKLKEKLMRFENNPFMKDTYQLVFERPLYCHFIKINLWILKRTKKVLDYFKL